LKEEDNEENKKDESERTLEEENERENPIQKFTLVRGNICVSQVKM